MEESARWPHFLYQYLDQRFICHFQTNILFLVFGGGLHAGLPITLGDLYAVAHALAEFLHRNISHVILSFLVRLKDGLPRPEALDGCQQGESFVFFDIHR